jgi:DNA (cytosine-5)-methyltransferase 1
MGDSYNYGQTTAKIGNSIIEGSYGSQTRTQQASESQGSGEQYGKMGNSKKLFGNGSNNNPRISMEHEKKFEFGNNGWEKDDIYNSNSTQFKRNKCSERINKEYAEFGSASWWQAEPNVGRVADGVAARVDRLKAIGNGQVPLCAATAWRILSA